MTMPFDDLHSSPSSNERPATDMGLHVTLLASLVSECEEIPANDSELSELLARLDSANTMASGVEAKVDEILGTLDDLLTSLEPKDSDNPQEATIPPSESQSEHSPPEQPLG